jgi:thiol peroxidase
MAKITLGGTPIETSGSLPNLETILSNFELAANDLSTKTLEDYKGFRKILNIFPSVDTGVCAASSTKVLCISRDLPFAQSRFCGAEGLNNVEMLSDFKTGYFGQKNGLDIKEGAFDGLHSRVVMVLDENNKVIYTEQVPEIGQEPNYKAALNALK